MSVAETLPTDVLAGLAGVGAARDQATLLITVDDDGMPRVSFLGRSEIWAGGDGRELRLALWAGSRTTANIRRSGQAVLFRVDGGVPRSIRLACAAPRGFTTSAGLALVTVDAAVAEVRADAVGYASLVSTLDFEVRDHAEVLPRWQEVQDHLSGAAPPAG